MTGERRLGAEAGIDGDRQIEPETPIQEGNVCLTGVGQAKLLPGHECQDDPLREQRLDVPKHRQGGA